MTRIAKKAEERGVLDLVLAGLGVRPDCEPELNGETPNSIITIGGRQIGVEITGYNSGEVIEGRHGRRQVESEWDKLKRAARAPRRATRELSPAHLRDPSRVTYFF